MSGKICLLLTKVEAMQDWATVNNDSQSKETLKEVAGLLRDMKEKTVGPATITTKHICKCTKCSKKKSKIV